MTSTSIATAVVAVLAAGAAPATQVETPESVTAHDTVRSPVDADGSSVHDWDGQRYDVPNDLLRSPHVLINGLSPQPAQFE